MADADRNDWRASLSDALTELNGALSARIGADRTEQVAEYIENHEFGLALELIIALVIKHNVDARSFQAGVESLSRRMEMEVEASGHLAAWRDYLARA